MPWLDRCRQLWQLLLPSPCLWCSLPVTQHQFLLCQHCRQALPGFSYDLCHYNLLFLPAVHAGLPQTSFDRLLSLGWYQQPYQHWISRWKFQRDPFAGELLRQEFSSLLQQYRQSQALPDAITYVPMAAGRERQRGFNQAKLLAETAANTLQLPILHCLQRCRNTTAQLGLGRSQRRKNLQQAFSLSQQTELPQHLALVDDVVTTGSTADQLCRLLKRHGVQQVSLWTLTVTPAGRHSSA
jgi:ComF family protein